MSHESPQVQIPLRAKASFVAEIDLAATKLGKTRSAFIREAIQEEVERTLRYAPGELNDAAAAPSRLGKGGKSKSNSNTDYFGKPRSKAS